MILSPVMVSGSEEVDESVTLSERRELSDWEHSEILKKGLDPEYFAYRKHIDLPQYEAKLKAEKITIKPVVNEEKKPVTQPPIVKVNPITEYMEYDPYVQLFVFIYNSDQLTYKYVTQITRGSMFNVTLILNEKGKYRELCTYQEDFMIIRNKQEMKNNLEIGNSERQILEGEFSRIKGDMGFSFEIRKIYTSMFASAKDKKDNACTRDEFFNEVFVELRFLGILTDRTSEEHNDDYQMYFMYLVAVLYSQTSNKIVCRANLKNETSKAEIGYCDLDVSFLGSASSNHQYVSKVLRGLWLAVRNVGRRQDVRVNTQFIERSIINFVEYDVALPQSLIIDNEEFFYQNHTRPNGTEIHTMELLGTCLYTQDKFKTELKDHNYYNPRKMNLKKFSLDRYDTICLQMTYDNILIVIKQKDNNIYE